jgi:putative ABC transport system permease protein
MALGLVLVVVGNGFIDAARAGLRSSYRDKYTGDLFIAALTKSAITVFGAESGPNAEKILPIADFPAVEKALAASPLVERWSAQVVAQVLLLVGEEARGVAQVLGIDPVHYSASFPRTIVFEEGGFWKAGEGGLILNASSLASLRKRSGVDLQVGDTLNVSLAEAGGKILELPLTGIAADSISQGPLSQVGWCDIDSLRLLKGYTLEATSPAMVETEPAAILDEESLFSDTSMPEAASSGIDLATITSQGIGRPKAAVADPAAWEIITIVLKEGVPPASARKALTKALAASGASAQVQDWIAGAGRGATPVLAVKSAFSLVILVVALVAVFIVMNALLISVSERSYEIGTMRALGGRRRVIRNLILLEVLFLGLIAGAAGLGISWLILGIVNIGGIPLNSLFLRMLFSGDHVRPVFSVLGSLAAWGGMIAVALVAGWYPARIALRLSPLKAIQSDS